MGTISQTPLSIRAARAVKKFMTAFVIDCVIKLNQVFWLFKSHTPRYAKNSDGRRSSNLSNPHQSRRELRK